MAVLSSVQRKVLEGAVLEARRVVEAACADRIAALGVMADVSPVGLSADEQQLRRGLRARQRQLGSAEVLVTEAGFEHWHRMLFSRLLADNGLLVDDQAHQPVSMAEVAEYATELGETDVWEVAARFASAMLPGIFRQDDPILSMHLPINVRQELEMLLGRLPVEITTAEDTLGWVYQYWQQQRKREINDSGVKIGGAYLAPVTQLFTEDYMVRFLLENSLGAWWAAMHPESPLIEDWEFLRRNEDGTPAAGSFEQWPQYVAEVTVMDPCCGSGHFLVAAFGMLWRMRAEEEGLEPVVAQDAVLRDNLYGLELDPRCAQIAMFALALEAWKQGGLRQLPIPHVACCGIPARAPLEEWTQLAKGDAQLEAALARLHTLFRDADTLGSLIDPVRATEDDSLESVAWHDIAPLLRFALTRETERRDDPAAAVFGEAAAGIARAADYLSRRYTLISTNVPYRKRADLDSTLQALIDANYVDSKSDLATVFVERLRQMLTEGGAQAVVTPQNWLFLTTYTSLRKKLLAEQTFNTVARLGKRAFTSISGEVVNVALLTISNVRPSGVEIFGLNCIKRYGPAAKEEGIRDGHPISVSQDSQQRNPDHRITLTILDVGKLLGARAVGLQGIATADYPRYGRKFWELPMRNPDWEFQQSTVAATVDYGGREHIVWWQGGRGELSRTPGVYIRGAKAWGKSGVAVSQMGSLPVTLYTGELFDNNTAVILPGDEKDLPAIWAYCSSPEFSTEVREIDDHIKVTNATLVKVPFDVDHWRQVAAERYPDGLPEPSSNDPTQWLFKGDVAPFRFPLQVAVARLLGFRWPDQEPDHLDELADGDGIVCLPAVGGEQPAKQRLRELMVAAYGDDWSSSRLDTLLAAAGGKPGDLGGWLRKGFFKDHCKVFANRPFIWQIWDGTPNGFSALINYHKLDSKLLERLTYHYLGSWWIERQRDEVRQDIPGAESRLVAAQELKQRLENILVGEPPYDLYVRWKSLTEQSIGWEPDLDNGVRMNIRPFMTAGVLRSKPNIKWNKDRGKNHDGSERVNDLHYTRVEKEVARRQEVLKGKML